ncbi:MAG: hypothetical protein Q8P59_09965 [Dehalococcoidia bacterium]|nr:hypothetical protein [Dehalococcoidia bacterium]
MEAHIQTPEEAWAMAAGDPCPGCGAELLRLLDLPLGGRGCLACQREEAESIDGLPPRFVDYIRKMKRGEAARRVIHAVTVCKEGHRALVRFDPIAGRPERICLACLGSNCLIESTCHMCGAYGVSYYVGHHGKVICRTGCANGHHLSTRL